MRAPCLLALLAVVALGCGGAPETQELVAVPYPDPARDRDPPAVPANTAAPAADLDDPDPAASSEPTVDDMPAAGPSVAATRDYLSHHAGAEVVDRDHLLADLTQDGTSEIVLATVGEDREATVAVARWLGDAFETAERVAAGEADELGRLRLADLGERASRVLVLALRLDGATRLAVWTADDDAGLRPPAECPLDASAVLRSSLGTPLLLACDDREAASGALVWHEGAFRPPAVGEAADDLLDAEGPTGAS